MSDDNKIQFDVELNEGSVEESFRKVDERAVKSAKESAAVFGEAFQRQEQELEASIQRIVASTKETARKSAKESADVFQKEFKRQDEIYQASVKWNIDQAIAKITGSNNFKKSAQESAAVFEDAFRQGLIGDPLDIPVQVPSSAGAIRGLADLAGGFYLVKEAINIVASAASAMFDVIKKGESEIKLEAKFEALAGQAGIVADVLKNDLTNAAQGFIGQSELLNVASEAFVQIGSNAKRLPEILELARKTYAVFGGDVVGNTEKITQAIATGNTRQLRQIGLLVDSEKVYKEYARSIGTVAPLLTEQQRQTALLNSVLEQGQQRFKNVSTETGSASDALKRAAVSTGEWVSQIAVAVATNFGPTVAKWATSIDGFIQKMNEAAIKANVFNKIKADVDNGIDSNKLYALSVKEIETRITQLTTSIEASETRLKSFAGQERFLREQGLSTTQLQNDLAKKKQVLDAYQKQLEEAKKKQDATLNAPSGSTGGTAGGGGTGTPVDTTSTEYIRRKEELVAKVRELNNQLRQSEVQLAQETFNRQRTAANLEALYGAQKVQATEQYAQQKAQLEKFYQDNGIIDQTMRNQGREALEAAHLNRMLMLRKQYEEQKKTTIVESENQALTTAQSFQAIMEGMEDQARETSMNASKNFKMLGRSMFQSVGQAAGNAFAAFGQAVAEGEDALQAFGKSLLNSLGQMAIQMGTQFILQGIAYTYAGLANGPPLIAAGAALAAFGGILAASGGAGPRDVSGGGGTAGQGIGSIADNDGVNGGVLNEDLEPQTPQTAVNLTINGNVLDRRETGLEIAKILEEQFADQGLVVRGT